MSEREQVNKKKIALLVAAGIGAAGTIAYFALNKKEENQDSPKDTGTADTSASPVKPKLLKAFKRKTVAKGLPASTAASSAAPAETSAATHFNADELAKSLSQAADAKDLMKVLSLLKQMRNTADYWLVDDKYKHLKWFGNRTIVTDLMDYAFKSDDNAKALIKKEFIRMGLAYNSSTDKWSLSGMREYNDIITLTDTYVIDGRGNRIPVKNKTILGEEVDRANGLTRFRAMDGAVHYVPTQHVKQA
jgi:hypothetical protein